MTLILKQGILTADENAAGTWRFLGSDWTLITWDIYIPATYYTYVYKGGIGVPCNPVQITSMVPWFDARHYNDPANAWFADPTLYINP